MELKKKNFDCGKQYHTLVDIQSTCGRQRCGKEKRFKSDDVLAIERKNPIKSKSITFHHEFQVVRRIQRQ